MRSFAESRHEGNLATWLDNAPKAWCPLDPIWQFGSQPNVDLKCLNGCKRHRSYDGLRFDRMSNTRIMPVISVSDGFAVARFGVQVSEETAQRTYVRYRRTVCSSTAAVGQSVDVPLLVGDPWTHTRKTHWLTAWLASPYGGKLRRGSPTTIHMDASQCHVTNARTPIGGKSLTHVRRRSSKA